MLAAQKRNEKGLTLIELLAVLVIVGIIAAIAIPVIGGTISKSKERADTATKNMITEAAMRYVIDENSTSTLTVTIKDLYEKSYLNAPVTWQNASNNGLDAVRAIYTAPASNSTTPAWQLEVIDSTP